MLVQDPDRKLKFLGNVPNIEDWPGCERIYGTIYSSSILNQIKDINNFSKPRKRKCCTCL